MKILGIMNRVTDLPASGRIHLVPKGEFPGVVEMPGKGSVRVVQVIDDEALDRMMAAFNRDSAQADWTGYLIDIEHFSHDAKRSSEAAAWVKALHREADGIWGDAEWTDLGQTLIANKRYKRLSPVFTLEHLSGDRYRAVALSDAGLTNAARLKQLVPIMNRDRNTEEAHMLELLRTILSMPDAAEDQLADRVRQALNRETEAAALETRATAAETERDELKLAALNRDAEAFVEKHKARIADPDKVKALFVRNREAAEEMIGLLKEPEPVKPAVKALNRADGKPPAGSPAAGDEEAEAARQRSQTDLVETIQARNRVTFPEAWNMAKMQRPDLFE